MANDRRCLSIVACVVLSSVVWLAPRAADAQPLHLTWAEELLDNLAPEDNEYDGSPAFITWAGVDGARRYSNRTQCATFLTELLKQAYGWTEDTFNDWLGRRSPNAATYYDAIVNENGFMRIDEIDEARAGDVLSLRYPSWESVSGHVAILSRAPVRRAATPPHVTGTLQFEVHVIDSSNFAHGTSDSRMSSGKFDAGAGAGVMRLYTDSSRLVVGHTWSTAATAAYYPASLRQVVIGRLQIPSRAIGRAIVDLRNVSRAGVGGKTDK